LGDLPVWVRLVVAMSVMLLITLSAMIYLTYVQRREGSLHQARDFAESVNQMTMATLTAMMIAGIPKYDAYLEQVRNSNNIKDLEVFRYGSIEKKFGPGKPARQPTAAETAVMKSGETHFKEEDGSLSAIYPILNLSNYLGKNCLGCHTGKEGEVVGAVSMRVSLQKANAELQSFTWWISLIALGLCVPLLGSIYVFVRRFVVRPLGGEPAAATEVAQRIAAGDLAVEVSVKEGDSTSLLAAMSTMRKDLSRIIGQINEAADTIAVSAKEIASGNADLSQRTEEQASSLEETASSMEELTGTVKRNAENARQASQLAAGASAVAVEGGEVVGQVVQTMSSIDDSSKKIVDIIAVIDGIAFQTNILALNAAVEAARAGEQGRGFAVVATEVRNLAQRSAAAAKEIKQLITDSVNKVEDGTRLVDQAGKTMEEVVASVKRVTDIVGEIAAASQEQSSGIEQVNKAVSQMDEVTQQNAALVEQAAAAAEAMEEQAQNLTGAVHAFKLTAGHAPRDRKTEPRAASVTRLPVRPAAAPRRGSAAADGKSAVSSLRAKTSGGGEWQEF
jgi:methyl-accepting chemotaxis protein